MKKPTVHEIVIRFVEDLPEEYISRVADLLGKESQFDSSRILHRIQSAIPQEAVRDNIRAFGENWERTKDAPSPREMALLVTSVAAALKYQQNKQSMELIWTGPKSRYIPLRRTDQALIELINSAKQRITIVSFAVYKAKNILSALEKAAKRGVEINIIVESPESSEGKIAFDSILALGLSLRSTARIFIWPYAKRMTTPDGKYGSLHAKVAISDSEKLYISSANLTEYAMNLNMEMGILIEGGDLPATTQNHFNELISDGTLTEIAHQ
jgi:phosphatidylserine/phosphatidylglycerophosphate/cardiolipin synthase-like enzyme